MTDVHPETRYRTIGVKLTDGTKTDVFTVGGGVWADVTGVTICASTGTAGDTATLAWYDVSGTTEYSVSNATAVPDTDNAHFSFDPLHLEPGDILRVTGANNQHVTISIIEGGRESGVSR